MVVSIDHRRLAEYLDSPRLAISFSGGRSSAVMTKILIDMYRDLIPVEVLFCNTGAEHPATYDFIRDCDRYWDFRVTWLEYTGNRLDCFKVVDYETADRTGKPFEAAVREYGLPGPGYPICTRELKSRTAVSYLRTLGWQLHRGGREQTNYFTAIGIRADEIDRISAKAMQHKIIYPLIDLWMIKQDINRFMADAPFDLHLPSDSFGNCTFCWKKTDRKLYEVANSDKSLFDTARRLEKRYEKTKYERISSQGLALKVERLGCMYRKYRKAEDIISLAKTYKEEIENNPQMSFLSELDVGGDCTDSCEVNYEL